MPDKPIIDPIDPEDKTKAGKPRSELMPEDKDRFLEFQEDRRAEREAEQREKAVEEKRRNSSTTQEPSKNVIKSDLTTPGSKAGPDPA